MRVCMRLHVHTCLRGFTCVDRWACMCIYMGVEAHSGSCVSPWLEYQSLLRQNLSLNLEPAHFSFSPSQQSLPSQSLAFRQLPCLLRTVYVGSVGLNSIPHAVKATG